jgi:uncharacterized protein GlcG (DUF336 family)
MWAAVSVTASIALSAAAPAWAQAPAAESEITQPVPPVMPFDIPYGSPITLATAQRAMTAALAEAGQRQWKMNCAIVEPTGDLVAFEKMDQAQYASIQIAQDKARTAARFRRPTKALFDAIQHGNPYIIALSGATPVEGGFPIIVEGKLIGAIGCSGGTGNQDATTAKAGRDAVTSPH